MKPRVTIGIVCIILCRCWFARTANITSNSSARVVDADHLADVEVGVEEFFGVAGAMNSSDDVTDGTTTEQVATAEVTSSPTASTTTTTPKTTMTTTTVTTTTTTTTTKKPVTRKPKPANRRVCSCDLHINSCDMNCCCDLECSEEEKKLFSYCLNSDFYEPKVTSPTSHSCFRTDIFYRENSPYLVRRTSGGLFCVVTENVEPSDELPSEPGQIDLKYLLQKAPKFSWKAFEQSYPEIPREPYRYGSALMKVTGTSSGTIHAGPFYLPSPLYGPLCVALESAKFLAPAKKKCYRMVPEVLEKQCNSDSELSVNYFLKNTAFISNPGMENLTESLVPLVFAVCVKDGGKKVCAPCSPLSDPVWDKKSGTCLNVLHDLELTFIHAGSQGLLKVVAKATLGSFDRNTTIIVQEYSTNFIWGELIETEDESLNVTTAGSTSDSDEHLDVNHVDFPRSGNPGYILGKPVLMGAMVVRITEKNATEAKTDSKEDSYEGEETEVDSDKSKDSGSERKGIALDKDPQGWMTIHKSGACLQPGSRRNNVYFGIAHQTVCVLNVSESRTCDELQERITAIILGTSSANFTDTPMYVSAFGNPDMDDLSEWVPVLLSSMPESLGKEGSLSPRYDGCDGIIATMKIKIAYAYVGSVRFPQAKIVGVLYEFGDAFSLQKKPRCGKDDTECENYDHYISVTTNVVFLDVTKAPVPRVGQWPVVSIKLPHEFFYPFATTSGSTLLIGFESNLILPIVTLFSSICFR